MEYRAVVEDGVLTIYGSFQSDGGWIVTHTFEGGWSLYEVPLYGGYRNLAGRFDTFTEAVEYAEENLI